MGLCAFNSTAPLDLVAIESRVRSSFSSAFMFALKPDPVRVESNASAWKSYDMQLQFFNINSQRFNSRLGSGQSAWRIFSLFKYHCFSQSSYFLISLEIILNNATTTTTIYFGIPIYIHGITYTSSTNQVLHVSKNNITDY